MRLLGPILDGSQPFALGLLSLVAVDDDVCRDAHLEADLTSVHLIDLLEEFGRELIVDKYYVDHETLKVINRYFLWEGRQVYCSDWVKQLSLDCASFKESHVHLLLHSFFLVRFFIAFVDLPDLRVVTILVHDVHRGIYVFTKAPT